MSVALLSCFYPVITSLLPQRYHSPVQLVRVYLTSVPLAGIPAPHWFCREWVPASLCTPIVLLAPLSTRLL